MRLPNAAEIPIIAADEKKQELQRKEDDEDITFQSPPLMRMCSSCEAEEQLQAKLMRRAESLSDTTGIVESLGFDSSFSLDRKFSGRASQGNLIQRNGRAPPVPQDSFEERLQGTKGSGMPISLETRGFMESRMGADFSHVRIHTGSDAVALSSDIHAHAFAHGRDVYFNSGKYAPDSASGRHLLAHELTHTIQQGASPSIAHHGLGINPKTQCLFAQNYINRAATERPAPPQLSQAVEKAKAESGQVNANKEGPDGNRTGWKHLVDYFKTTLGPENVLSAGGNYKQGAVSEQDIKKKREISGALPPAHPSVERHGPYVRDAMPSWCGIFVFWALHKAGVPMKPWQLGGRVVTADAAYLPGHIPQVGDIAYRQNYSHFAIVEKTSGNTVTTVNGNTAGEDNLGGQVQTRDHPLSDWTAFFDPLMLKDGPLSSGETQAESQRPLSLNELRKKLFHIDASLEDEGGEPLIDEPNSSDRNSEIQAKPELSTWGVRATGVLHRHAEIQTRVGQEQSGQRKEEQMQEEEQIQETEGSSFERIGILEPQSDFAASTQANNALNRQANKASSLLIPASLSHAQSLDGYELQGKQIEANKGPPGLVQRNILGDAWDAASDAVGDAYDAASDFAEGALEWAEDQLNEAKEYILGRIRDYVADVPGYKLLCVILQQDPVTGAAVARNGNNLLEAALDVIPVMGAGIRTLLIRTGTWEEAAGFVEGRVDDFVSLVSNIGDRVVQFIDGLGIADIRHPVTVLENFYNLVRGIIEDVVGFVCRSAQAFVDMVKRVVITQVAAFVKQHIPRLYPFLRVAFGFDPITNEQVPRNGTNILNALFAVTDEGEEQKRQLIETGAFQRVAAWIDQGISVFTNLYQAIRSGFSLIWDVISVDSLLHPVETFERIYNHFATPVAAVFRWIANTALFIIQAIKDALLSRLSNWAKGQRGYFLITLLIGRDPFTNVPVPFSVENVIHAFMSLMEGGEEQFQQMKESGAIDRTTNRIHAAVRRLGFTVEYILGLFTGLWRNLHLGDLANPFALFRRVYQTFAQPVRRLIAFVVEIVKIVVEVILQIMQFPVDLVGNIIARAMEAWDRIKSDPIGFLKNLIRAIQQGFVQFFDHIVNHLLRGLTGWLMAEMRDSGLPVLEDFSLRGIISWILQVLGVGMEAIWQKLAQHPRIGPEKVARIRGMMGRLEGIWTFINDVQERGISTLWDKIQEQLSNLWDTVLDAVKNWVMEQIISRITARLLSMLDPTGIMAVINGAIAFYRAVQSFLRYLRQLLEVVNSFVQGVADIAAGNVATAANYLESTMSRAMPIVIGFLANQVGLSGIGRRIGEMIGRVRELVDRAITWLVNKAVDTGYALFERLLAMGHGRQSEEGGTASLNSVKQELHSKERSYLTNGAIHQDEAQLVADDVARRNRTQVRAIRVVDGGSKWNYDIIQRETEDGAPKDTTGGCFDPGTAPATIGNITRHGSQGSSMRTGEQLHWLESEHVLPFATGRSIWQALALFLPERGWPEDNQQTTIMIYYGAARIKTPMDNQVSAAINAATPDVSEELNRRRASLEEQRRGTRGRNNEEGQDMTVAREILHSILTPVQQAKEQAVVRTNAAITQEHARVEQGCTKTNGQRRGEVNPMPTQDAVERAANQQYEDVLGLVTNELLAAEQRRQRMAARGLI
ncbi:MAG: DUF4157 domain-containing protein [Bacteroidetes bacterium]|nr:DUF4157 domain-containing protein [Bacteroidota bacterium]MBS1630591.1 DUF4157 domain-containing protein [Bacteroidota bacterium]